MEWYTLALVSAILSAAAAVAEKKSLFKVSPLEFSTILSLLSLFLSIPFIFAFNMQEVSLASSGILFVKSIFNALAFFCVMSALKKLDISNSLPLMNLTPGFVAILALLILREHLNLWQSTGLLLLMSGTYLLNINKNDRSFFAPFMAFFKSKGHKFILVALFSFTLTSVLDKVVVGTFKMPPEAFIFFQHLFSALLFSSCLLFIRRKRALSSAGLAWRNSGKYILLVAFLTIGYRYSQILAVMTGKVALVLAVKRLSIFFACLAGGRIFREIDLKRRLTATFILIAGALMVVMF